MQLCALLGWEFYFFEQFVTSSIISNEIFTKIQQREKDGSCALEIFVWNEINTVSRNHQRHHLQLKTAHLYILLRNPSSLDNGMLLCLGIV